MTENKVFSITVHLSDILTDQFSAKIFISNKMKLISDLKNHVSSIFNIHNFDFKSMDTFLPEAEDIQVLNSCDFIRLVPKVKVPLAKSLIVCAECDNRNKYSKKQKKRKTDHIQDCEGENVVEKKKKHDLNDCSFQPVSKFLSITVQQKHEISQKKIKGIGVSNENNTECTNDIQINTTNDEQNKCVEDDTQIDHTNKNLKAYKSNDNSSEIEYTDNMETDVLHDVLTNHCQSTDSNVDKQKVQANTSQKLTASPFKSTQYIINESCEHVEKSLADDNSVNSEKGTSKSTENDSIRMKNLINRVHQRRSLADIFDIKKDYSLGTLRKVIQPNSELPKNKNLIKPIINYDPKTKLDELKSNQSINCNDDNITDISMDVSEIDVTDCNNKDTVEVNNYKNNVSLNINFESHDSMESNTRDLEQKPQDISSRRRTNMMKFGVGNLIELIKKESDSTSDLETKWTSDTNTDVEIKRKRKRVRTRKSKGKMVTNEVKDVAVVPFKPPNSTTVPRQHIIFSDDEADHVINNSALTVSDSESVNVNSTVPSVKSNGTTPCTPLDLDNKSIVENAVSYTTIPENVISQCPLMDKMLPKMNDLLVFKIMKLTESYNPDFSNNITAKVVSFDDITKQVVLCIVEGKDEFTIPDGKFSMIEDNIEAENENADCLQTLAWNELIQPRLLYP